MSNLQTRFEEKFGFKFEHGWKIDDKKKKQVPDFNNLVGTGPNGATIGILGPLGKPKRAHAIMPIFANNAELTAKSVECLNALIRAYVTNPDPVIKWVGGNARPATLENKARKLSHEGKEISVSGRLATGGAVIIVEIVPEK